MKGFLRAAASAVLPVLLVLSFDADAARIKDISSFQGVRTNQLMGYGLVVGLPGTGEKNNAFSEQTFRTMLNNFGIKISDNLKPKMKDVAPVVVHAELPPFAKQGQTIDVTVSAIGEAKSLRGGTLIQTFLRGADNEVYAVAQGSLVVGGFGAEGADGSKIVMNTPTVGRIANGATVEREVPTSFGLGDTITINLNKPDFTTAMRTAQAINDELGIEVAKAKDASSVTVSAPRDQNERVQFVATLENLEVDPADAKAKIVVNARTGTIIIGQNVKLRPAAVTHGGLTVTIREDPQVSQPAPLSNGTTQVVPNSSISVQEGSGRMFKFDAGATLDDLVKAVNDIGLAPGDLISVLEALQQAGAIRHQAEILSSRRASLTIPGASIGSEGWAAAPTPPPARRPSGRRLPSSRPSSPARCSRRCGRPARTSTRTASARAIRISFTRACSMTRSSRRTRSAAPHPPQASSAGLRAWS